MLNTNINSNHNNSYPSKKKACNITRFYKPAIATIGTIVTYNTINKNLTQQTIKFLLGTSFNEPTKYDLEYKQAIEKSFKFSKLSKKGTKICDTTKTCKEDVFNIIKKELPIWYKFSKKNYRQGLNITTNIANSIISGKNGIFAQNSNIIVLNTDKKAITFFHELGHAHNKCSYIGNLLQKIRGPFNKLTIPLIFLIGIHNTQNTDNKLTKITSFITNNCIPLMLLTKLPTLLEEGLATINGIKFAKPFIPKKALRKLINHNTKTFSIYLASAICSVISTKFALMMHNFLQNKSSAIRQ